MLNAVILKLVLMLIKKLGVPAVEAKWPSLKPIIDEIFGVMRGEAPSASLDKAVCHYNDLCSIGIAPEIKKN